MVFPVYRLEEDDAFYRKVMIRYHNFIWESPKGLSQGKLWYLIIRGDSPHPLQGVLLVFVNPYTDSFATKVTQNLFLGVIFPIHPTDPQVFDLRTV